MKKENVIWGLVFIFAGIFLLVNRLDILPDFNLFKLFLTIVLFVWFGVSITKLEFGGILFSLAFLAIMYDDYLGIERLTPWPVLGAAAFCSIGLSMIFRDQKERRFNETYVHRPAATIEDGSTRIAGEETRDSQLTFNTSFGSSAKYVKSDDFQSARINCSFGEMKVYFDDAMIQQESASIYADVKFGSVILYIPKTWKVENHASAVFGNVSEKNRNLATEGTPTINLGGDVAFGSVMIYYI